MCPTARSRETTEGAGAEGKIGTLEKKQRKKGSPSNGPRHTFPSGGRKRNNTTLGEKR